jgi:hypothetical protein
MHGVTIKKFCLKTVVVDDDIVVFFSATQRDFSALTLKQPIK